MISQWSLGRVLRSTHGVEVGSIAMGVWLSMVGFWGAALEGMELEAVSVVVALRGLRMGPSGIPMVCRSCARAEAS